jgi:hypothetical protein
MDREGKPFDPSIEIRETPGVRVSTNCSVSYVLPRPGDEMSPVGFLGKGHVAVTLLDEDYATVKGCYMMVYNKDEHIFLYERNMGLFDVGVHVMIFYTKDEN